MQIMILRHLIPLLDLINNQVASDEQLEQALQTYQALGYGLTNYTFIPNRSMNPHTTYHVDNALHSKHESVVDRGANGSLAGSDVRILSKLAFTIMKLQDLDIVQCTALVQTQHGIVNLIMNEYAYSGQEPTIHSSGQIEWYNNFVDDKSTQVGGTQVIITYDGYIMPLVSREGLMHLEFLGKPTHEDLVNYP